MAYTAIWVPGSIVQVEHPERLTELMRKGWGTFFKQHGDFNWFHLPVATPVTLSGENLSVSSVFVLFRATDGPRITNIHVYDGPKLLQAFDGLVVAGDLTVSGERNLWDLTSKQIMTAGLGISVGVDFRDGGEILFTGAGAQCQTATLNQSPPPA